MAMLVITRWYINLDLHLDPRSTVLLYIRYLDYLYPIHISISTSYLYFCPYQYLIAISISSLNLCLRMYIYIYIDSIYYI